MDGNCPCYSPITSSCFTHIISTPLSYPSQLLHTFVHIFSPMFPTTAHANVVFPIRLMACSAHVTFLILIVIRMSLSLVCFLIHDTLYPSIVLSKHCSLHSQLDTLNFRSRAFIRLQVSDAYVRTCRMHLLYTLVIMLNYVS